MLILYLSGREVEYTRNDVLIRALKRFATVDVVAERGSGSILFRSLRLTMRAIPKLVRDDYDLVVVGFYGHLLMLLVGLFAQAPILFDAFISTYDTLVDDRRRLAARSPGARLAKWLDRAACARSTHVLLDTPEHAAYFEDVIGVESRKLSALPVGCNEDIFSPRPAAEHGDVHVLFYCTYLPLHGAEVVVEAAALLKSDPDLKFRLLGHGPDYQRVRARAEKLGLPNLAFFPPIPIEHLAGEISQADICLGGHFGRSGKAGRVVPGKIYQILAMGRPLIAAETEANSRLLVHGRDALLSPPDDPEALAAAIADLAADPARRATLGQAGRNRYLDCCSESFISTELEKLVDRILG